ncbi:hypothetical protein FB565_002452 [Actinoplanes lutulentus]|uniref:IPT/TIG domain-containing protein n=1 Tax=Actinoplanes lutulentus TaxID=1287878 RepID=UPI0015EC76E4|nr:IPT/TIG domain-containing protein [Actinoplanes lutulentus]MBB2942739.1 hypothetical protein [Actinoplanes lutulentus]
MIRAGIAAATVTAATVASAALPAAAATVPLTLSSANGPTGSATVTITASHSTAWLTGVSSPNVTLSMPACQTTYNTTASSAVTPSSATVGNIVTSVTASKINNFKAAFLLPSLDQAPNTATSTKYNICVYSGTGSSDVLIGNGTYTVASPAALDVTTPILPANGPALGGTTVTVIGTGFPTTATGITATLGGAALTGITPISSTKFTAVTPARQSGSAALTVTTAAGTVTKSGVFTYSNGIAITPNTNPTVPNGTPALNPTIDIIGVGFQSSTYDFSDTLAAAAKSHVFLTEGAYAAAGTQATPVWTTPPVTDCTGVVVISDTEIICKLNLNKSLGSASPTAFTATQVPEGTYTLTVVANGAPGAITPNPSDISSGSTFTVSAY